MAADIYIVSGFLGAGKTTLIQKLLGEVFRDKRVVLVENDFGEVGVDAALMRSSGVEVAELSSGCICCNISGDFKKSLRELLLRYRPESVIIEPSGVGKLSEIAEACSDPSILALAGLRSKITVADAGRCRMYFDNFGEFFEDQIANADAVVLSRCEEYPDSLADARALARELNDNCPIFSAPWPALDTAALLAPQGGVGHDAGDVCGHAHAHNHGCRDGCCDDAGHVHDHEAADIFDAVTVYSQREFDERELGAAVAEMELGGTLLRAKGTLRGRDGFWELQYIPGELKITRRTEGGADGALCVLGRDLDSEKIAELFGGTTGVR
ncbi:MAG: GTP-binding protein [Oscillospiraceae bacterium]|jgi:G3E family GTPase|nr:GTP-binding protein [Oscillospiraceae bacterium]